MNYPNAVDKPCQEERNELYDLLDNNLRIRGTKFSFHVSQAVWTPDEKQIKKWTFGSFPRKPSLYRWTEHQYQAYGPFDKWLGTVETCKTNVKCCENPSGIGNIIMRDFPTPRFGSAVVNKNFQFATGKQRTCEDKQIAEAKAEAERQKKAAEKEAKVRN